MEQGAFRIVEQPDGRIDFVTRGGRLMTASDPTPVDPVSGGLDHLRKSHEAAGIAIDMFTPIAKEAGEAHESSFVVDVFLDHRARRERQACLSP